MPDIQAYWDSLTEGEHRIASEALEKSIQHWRENVEAETPDKASVKADDCALCALFANEDMEYYEICIGCPVMHGTGQDSCEGSPYYKAVDALRYWKAGTSTREAFTAAAQAELDFLISLRPKEKEDAGRTLTTP